MLRRYYDWMVRLSERPQAVWVLGAVSFAESSFFPMPPDVMLLPMSVARPDRALWYAAVCTVTSVIGGLLGYAIGALLYDSVGQWLIHAYGYQNGMDAFRTAYQQWGAWIILIKGLTPIPYKIVTITSGFASYNLFWFVVLSAITRGGRFFILAGILNYFGEPLKTYIESHLGLVVGVFVAILVGGFIIARYLI